MAAKIIPIEEKRWERTRETALALLGGLPPEDQYVLQNDVLARDPAWRSRIPSDLQEAFREWLRDMYGPVERETAMAPENQTETEARFLEERMEDSGFGEFRCFADINAALSQVKSLAGLGALNDAVEEQYARDRCTLVMTDSDWYQWTDLVARKAAQLESPACPAGHAPINAV